MPFYLVFPLLFLSGCALWTPSFPQKSTPVSPSQASQQALKSPTEVHKHVPKKETLSPQKPVTGYIKGTIQTLGYNASDGVWEYEIKGTDTSNSKLSYARFTHSTRQYRVGDVVYAHIKAGRLVEMHALTTQDTRSVPVIAPSKGQEAVARPQKRTRTRQVISVPKSETIIME